MHVVFTHIFLCSIIKPCFCICYIRCRQRNTKYYKFITTMRLLIRVRHQRTKGVQVFLDNKRYLTKICLWIFCQVALFSVWQEIAIGIVEVFLVVIPINGNVKRTTNASTTTHIDFHFLCYACTSIEVEIKLWQRHLEITLLVFAVIVHRVVPLCCWNNGILSYNKPVEVCAI